MSPPSYSALILHVQNTPHALPLLTRMHLNFRSPFIPSFPYAPIPDPSHHLSRNRFPQPTVSLSKPLPLQLTPLSLQNPSFPTSTQSNPLPHPGRSQPEPLRRALGRALQRKQEDHAHRRRRLQHERRRQTRQRQVETSHPPSSPILHFHQTPSDSFPAAANGLAAGNANAHAAASAEEGGKKTKSREAVQSVEQSKAVAGSKRVDHLGIEGS